MKYKYNSLDETPMKYYKALRAILPFSCVFGVLGLISLIFEYQSIPEFYLLPIFWLDIALRICILIVLFFAVNGLSRLYWSGVLALYLYIGLIAGNRLIIEIISNSSVGSLFGCILGAFLLFFPNYIYFSKRRPLFYPVPFETSRNTPISDTSEVDDSFIPTICSEKVASGSPSEKSAPDTSAKSKKPIFERYHIYIVCPDCGSMQPEGTKRCGCGHIFSNPVRKVLRRFLPVFACLTLLLSAGAGGYFLCLKQTQLKLAAQYQAGYEDGKSDGYEAAESNYEKVFEDGYRTALADNAASTHDTVIPWLIEISFPGRDELHSDLARQYGFTPKRPMPILSKNGDNTDD